MISAVPGRVCASLTDQSACAFQKLQECISLADHGVDMLVPREGTCDSNPDMFLISDTLKLDLVEVIVVC